MTVKMIKYEFKQMSPVLLVAFIALFFVTLIGFLIGVLPILIFGGKDLGTGIWSILMASISFLAYAFILMVIAIGMNIFIGYRFYKSMYSSTGYFTHTLPLSTNELILGKTIPAIAVQILIDLMVIISGVIIFLGYYVAKDGFDNAIYNISSLLQIFEGRYFKSHRILMGVVSFIVINRIIAAFEWVINLIVTEVAKADYYSTETGTIISLIFIVIINIAVLIISYVLNYYIISNKLNLE